MGTMQQPITKFKEKGIQTFSDCNALKLWDGVIKDKNVVFPAGCSYEGQVKFMAGGLTLDCNSSTIQGSPGGKAIVSPDGPTAGAIPNAHDDLHSRYTTLADDGDGVANPQPLLAGIVIGRTAETGPDGCRLVGPAVSDVTIQNCRVTGFYQGIRLDRQLAYKKVGSDCEQPPERTLYTGYVATFDYDDNYDEEYKLERTALYNHAPQRVRIIDSIVEKNGHAGIYVMPYSQSFSISGTTVQNNGSVGIYLSHETRYSTIDRSSIVHNGWGSNHSSVNYRVAGVAQVEKMAREGIAIDSSAHNTISRNHIVDNWDGGIALYKNCGEDSPNPGPIVIRKQHSDYNRILHNTIALHLERPESSDEGSGYGVWLAMRQMQEYSTADGNSKHCRDTPVAVDDVLRSYDYANFNTIAYNSFEDNWASVRVGDDFNQIIGNQFHGDTKYDMYIGEKYRGELGYPVRGTIVVKNRSFSVTSNASGRTIVPAWGSGDQTFFLGDMYYERRGLPDRTNEHCLAAADGAPFNDCDRPDFQQRDGIFWD